MSDPKPKRNWTPTRAQIRASDAARAQADREAARIPWTVLLKARRDYIRWQAYSLWVRSIEETLGELPDWLAESVEKRAPGYQRYARDYGLHQKRAPCPKGSWRTLELWVSERAFHKPRTEGWMNAVGYYAVKDLASLRDDAYAEWCIENWKTHPPAPFPSFKAWRKASEEMTDQMLNEVEMRDDRRELIKHMRSVRPRALDLAVEKYVGWQIFALWMRAALEELPKVPDGVKHALDLKCPGFLERGAAGPYHPRTFALLMQWIEDRFFAKPKREGWCDVLRYEAGIHPRLARAKSYWIDREHEWTRGVRDGYPSFEAWNSAIDRYTVD